MADKLKILVVEDNVMNKILVKEVLTLNGYEIIEAKTGTEALKVFVTVRPDLVLMDIQLPEMDGVTAMRVIKSDKKNKKIPVIALTASAMKGEEEKILNAGFDGYIAKPIDTKKLVELVGTCLKGK
ncbi:MAG: response regulator [Deltaproteobacteria bacterium]|nr:response regulator [Deltaproteobacteria bacterium]